MNPPDAPTQRALDLLHAGRSREAEAGLRRHIAKVPQSAAANHVMAGILLRNENPAQAEHFARRAAALEPGDGIVLSMLASALAAQGKFAEAEPLFRSALERAPTDLGAMSGLAGVLLSLDRAEEGVDLFRAVLDRAPTSAGHAANLALALTRAGRLREALEIVNEGLRHAPDVHPLLLHRAAMLNYDADASPAEIANAHQALGRAIERRVGRPSALNFDANPDRVIRVGLLSADFRRHSVACFVAPILREWARCGGDVHGVRLVCVASVETPDVTTAELRALGIEWLDIARLDDDAAAAAIRRARIDVLIDLGGHSHGSRVEVLARRAAPAQATYLGYPNVTGLSACDARFVDSHTDPPEADAPAGERLIRLDPCFLCYEAPSEAPTPAISVPSARAGTITFGSFNALLKVTGATLDLWAGVLRELPGSRLVLKDRLLAGARMRERLLAGLQSRGVEPARVELFAHTASIREHLALYDSIDVAFDPFPYHGTTTTCDALWMGVPVVSLAGRTHARRVGVSILSNVGLRELACDSAASFVRTAIDLAEDATRRAELRTTLREQVRRSSLCDAPAFALRFAHAVRGLWRLKCELGGVRGAAS